MLEVAIEEPCYTLVKKKSTFTKTFVAFFFFLLRRIWISLELNKLKLLYEFKRSLQILMFIEQFRLSFEYGFV